MKIKPRPIGLIGLGLVGGALAERLRRAGFRVVGFDVDVTRRRTLKKLGGHAAESAAEIFAACDRVLLSLPNSNVVESVLREAAPQLRRGLRIIDTTTGEPDATARLGAKLARRGVRYLDATIVGSSAQVLAGEVLVLVGGKRADFVAARDVFGTFAKQAFHVGPCGSGARMKLVVNLVLGLNRAVLAEGIAFAGRVGFSQKLALEILKAGAAYSRVMDTKGAKMLARDFKPQAKLAQHLKDVRLILQLGRKRGAKLPLSTLHQRMLAALARAGFADADNSAIIEAFAPRRPVAADVSRRTLNVRRSQRRLTSAATSTRQ
ncbi:MAG: NAD(P)-dependent oxidoreductase [Verrucomicrobia bacterium]|nr:NAD(P)-dependent oxidoreductase [Verrucomicrobiota bacterium]